MRNRVALSSAGFRLHCTRVAIHCLLAILMAGVAAFGQARESLQVIDLGGQTAPETLARAHAKLKAGTAILRVTSGDQGEMERLIGIPLMSVNVKNATTKGASASSADLQRSPSLPLRAAAAYKDEHGVMRSAVVFSSDPKPASVDGGRRDDPLNTWIEHEQARTTASETGGGPEPPAEAWTSLYRTTLLSDDANSNRSQLTIGVFRLNSISKNSDFYMVATVPQNSPAWDGSCRLGFDCGWHTLSRETRMGSLTTVPDASPILVDHGPTGTSTEKTTGFHIGGSLSKDGPGVDVGYSEDWSTDSLTTFDRSTETQGHWPEQFQFSGDEPCHPIGNLPPLSTGTSFSRQAGIFEVPSSTAEVVLPIEFDTDFCSTQNGADPFAKHFIHSSTIMNIRASFGPPVLQATPPSITIPSGGAANILVDDYIPGSTEGFSWTVVSNQLWATVPSGGPFSTTRLLPITIAPGTQNGLQAVLSINSDPKYAAPSVRTGPLEVYVNVGTPKKQPAGGVLIVGGYTASGVEPIAEVYDYNIGHVLQTGAPKVARVGHTATRLQDGRVLLVGGATAPPGTCPSCFAPVTASAEIYDPANFKWISTGNLKTARAGHTATRLADGKVLITGGKNGNGNYLTSAELYDPASGTFTDAGNMEVGRSQHYADLIRASGNAARVVIYGGVVVEPDKSRGAEVWDESTLTFTPADSLPIGRFGAPSPVPIDRDANTLETVGGNADGAISPNELLVMLDNPPAFAAGTAKLNQARVYHTLTALQNRELLVTGGASDPDGQDILQDGELGNASGWTKLSSQMIAKRAFHTATLLPDGRVFLAGGRSAPNLPNGTTEFFDPAMQTFSLGPNIAGRYGHTATLFSNSVTDLAANPSNPTYGQNVSISAQVRAASGASTGTITFLDGSAIIATAKLSGGTATFDDAKLSVGTHVLTASYSGDEPNAPSTSTPVKVDVTPASSSTSLSTSPNPSPLGQPVVLTATVGFQSGTGSDETGTVTFQDGTAVLGTQNLVDGKASLTTSSLAVGTHAITATFNSDNTHSSSTSAVINQVVNEQDTVTTIAAAPLAPIFGQDVTFTSSVSYATKTVRSKGGLTGTVVYKDNDSVLGQATLTDGSAKLTTSALGSGPHRLTATYLGDSDAAGSTSAALLLTVAKAKTTTSLQSSDNPSTLGDPVMFSVRVISSAGIPTGTVTFSDGATAIGSPVTLVAGQADLSTSALSGGSHLISAAYSGSDNFVSSSSPAVQQQVNAVSTKTDLQSSVNPSSPSEPVTFTATVSSTRANVTGKVTFYDDAAILGPAVTLTSGVALFSTTTLTTGSHAITARYSGDKQHAVSTSSVLTQKVVSKQIDTTTSVSASPNPASVDQPVTFHVQVLQTSGKNVPTGTVVLRNDGATLQTLTLDGGTASYTTSDLGTGKHSITAAYQGGSAFTASTSATLTQVINGLIRPTVTLTSSPNPSMSGETVMFTATVSSPGNPTPTGSMTISEDFPNQVLIYGSATLRDGVGLVTTEKLTAGIHEIRATYGGDDTLYSGASSNLLHQQVNVGSGHGGSFGISGPSEGVVGLPAGTFTITPLDEKGKPMPDFHATVPVNFKGPGNTDRTALVNFVGGASKATFTSAFPQVGTYRIDASYEGMSGSLAITASEPNVQVSASNQDVAEGTPVTLSAHALGNGKIITTGTIFFTLNGRVLYSSSVDSDGSVQFTTSSLPEGHNVVSAVYRSPDIYGTARQAHATVDVVVGNQ